MAYVTFQSRGRRPPHLVVIDYDPEWPSLFGAERERLVAALGDAVLDIRHVGSTSVPGLAGKPVIDIALVMRTMPPTPDRISALESLGYEHKGEHGITGRAYFRKGLPRSHQIHMFASGHPALLELLLFRDFLRAHADAAAQYAKLKREAAASAVDTAAYVDAKSAFISESLERARTVATSRPTGAQPEKT